MRALLPVTALLVLLSPAGSRGAGAPLAVPLLLDESAGVARRAAPVSASVPFARGQLPKGTPTWVADAAGHAVPSQPTVLEPWPDGSVRWLLVDFLADVPAHGRATYTLHPGTAPAPASGPRITSTTARDGARTLDTGVLRVTLPLHGEAWLGRIAAGDTTLSGGVPLPVLTVEGGASGGARPGTLTVETDGPVRTEVVLRGRYPGGLAYETRLALFAGQALVRVEHTLTNMTDPDYARIRSLALRIPGRFLHGGAGVDGRQKALEPGSHARILAQETANELLLDGARVGRRGDGWVRAGDDRLALTALLPRFWEEYPAALGVGRDALEVDLFAGRERPVALGRGAAKTHELWLALEKASAATSGAALAAELRAPLIAFPPPEWIVASGALPQALAPDAPGARSLLARLSTAFVAYQKHVRTDRWDDGPPVPCSERTTETPRTGFYGVLNWGDWNFPRYRDTSEGCDGWGNLEYDLPQVLALGFVATRNRELWDTFVAAARHYRDVDVIHYMPEHPDWVGLNHPHKASHFAPESRSKVDLGHTWAEGLITHYRLTGERRSLEAARALADALIPRVEKAGNPRQRGWPMIALSAVAAATNEPRYLDGARAFAAGVLAHVPPTPASGDWKMGIMADGMAYLHAARGEDDVRRWLLAYADALLAEPDRFTDPRYALPLGYLAVLTGDDRYERLARRVAEGLKLSDWGKPIAAMGRTGFRLLAPLDARPPVGK